MPSDTDNGRSPRRINSLENLFELLEIIKHYSGISVSELTEQVHLSKGTVHTYLQTLESLGYVKRVDGGYDLGQMFIPLSEYVRNRSVLFNRGCDEVDKLAFDCEEYVHLMSEVDGLEIALYASRGENAIGTEYYRRMREEPQKLHYSSAGKSILAHLPEPRVRKIIDRHGLEARTDRTITEEAELFDALKRIRDRGYAVNDEEEMVGMRAVGAPILDADGIPLGAVSVSGPKARLDDEFFTEDLPSKVMQTANLIELNIKTEQTNR